MTTRAKPFVYCNVINIDGKELLLETLDSLKKMTYENFRILLVDNGSSDGSAEAVRAAHPDVHVIENGKNLGFGEGNNVGMEYALQHGAEWILLLNNDIVVDPAMLGELMNVALSNAKAGILGPKIYYFSTPDVIWCAGCDVNYWTGQSSHRGLRQKDTGKFDTVAPTGYVNGCAMLIRRTVLEKIGLFDPIYSPSYVEDADLSVRASRAGYDLLYVPKAKLWHKVSSYWGGKRSSQKTQLKIEHNLIFFKRYARWYHWITIPFFIAGGALVFVVKEMFRGNFGVVAGLGLGFVRALRRLISG